MRPSVPPALMIASAHRTTSSSYSPLFTTRTSMFLFLRSQEIERVDAGAPAWGRGSVAAQTLPQTLHYVLHVAGVDVVSLQQAAVAGALHRQLENRETPGQT